MGLIRFLQQESTNKQLKKQTKIMQQMAKGEAYKTSPELSPEKVLENHWRKCLDKQARGEALSWQDKVNIWDTECPPHLRQEYAAFNNAAVSKAQSDKMNRWMLEKEPQENVARIERADDV